MDLRYPVGKFDWQAPVAPEMRPGLIAELAAAPDVFRQAVAGLNDAQRTRRTAPMAGWFAKWSITWPIAT